MTTANSDVLRRKLRSESRGEQEQAMSPAKALRMGLARAADQVIQLALRVDSIRQQRLTLAETLEQVPMDWALFPLVHDDGSVGAICVDPACAIAFVEQQTTGRLMQAAPDSRTVTRTDKALTQPLLACFLQLFDAALEGAPTAYWTRGYRCDDPVETRHLLALQLDSAEYRSFNVAAEFAETTRKGAVRLFLPIKEPARNRGRTANKQDKADTQPQLAQGGLRRAALAAQVELRAIMCRLHMPLSQLNTLEAGQLLALPSDAMQTARLEDRQGKTAFPVHLGQVHGMRAVRLPQTAETVQKAKALSAEEQQALRDAMASDALPKPASRPARGAGQDHQASAQAEAELDALLMDEGI